MLVGAPWVPHLLSGKKQKSRCLLQILPPTFTYSVWRDLLFLQLKAPSLSAIKHAELHCAEFLMPILVGIIKFASFFFPELFLEALQADSSSLVWSDLWFVESVTFTDPAAVLQVFLPASDFV